jgi:putative sterol carrier protein
MSGDRESRVGVRGIGVSRTATPPTAERAAAVFGAFVDVMSKAADDSELGRRLAQADVVTHVHLRDSPQRFVLTLLFDRAPVEIAEGAIGTPDVELLIDTQDVLRFWTGDLQLAIAIMYGEVETRGPVRKLLRVVPIARRLVKDFQVQAAASGLTTQATPTADTRA